MRTFAMTRPYGSTRSRGTKARQGKAEHRNSCCQDTVLRDFNEGHEVSGMGIGRPTTPFTDVRFEWKHEVIDQT